MSPLEARGLGYRVAGKPLVHEAGFALEPGTLTMLIGPNGAGKTTLLRLLAGLLAPDTGESLTDGEHIAGMAHGERARRIAYLPQARPLVWPQPVRDIVALGRFAHGGAPGRLSPTDSKAVARAMAACDLAGMEERSADTLSGGELSRVHLARALAGETPVLLADEPVAALDPRYQHQALRLFAAVAAQGRCVLAVVHDLALAARYANRLLWMKEGWIIADGPPTQTVTAERLRSVFGIEAHLLETRAGTVTLDITGPA